MQKWDQVKFSISKQRRSVTIQEIMEENIPSTQERMVHYYVDIEGDEEEFFPFHKKGPSTTFSSNKSQFLQLSQHPKKPQRKINDKKPRFDYSKSAMLTSDMYIESMEVIAKKKTEALLEKENRKKER